MIRARDRLRLLVDLKTALGGPKQWAKLTPLIEQLGGTEAAAKFALKTATR